MSRKNDPKAVQLITWSILYSRWFRSNPGAFVRALLPAAEDWARNHPGQAAANRVRSRQTERHFPHTRRIS